MMRVSAGIVRYPDGRILICRRGEGRKNAHLWEFPGGKQEAGESPEDALRRELLEELSLPIADISPLCRREAQGIAFDFLTATATRAPVLTEHEGYALVHPAEMTKYVFCPADEVVARQIAFANVRACLWDFDGTLMDTYPLLTEVFVRIAAENGVRLTAENALSLLKGTLRDACAALSALMYKIPAGGSVTVAKADGTEIDATAYASLADVVRKAGFKDVRLAGQGATP